MKTSTAPHPCAAATLAAIALPLACALLTGCGTANADDAAAATPSASDPSASDTGEAAAPQAGADLRTPVGPLLLGAPDYWQVGDTTDGRTPVQAEGCTDGQTCPAFAVLQGEALPAGFDASQASTQDGTGCPNGLTPQAAEGESRVTEIVVDGVAGTLTELQVGCADQAGAVQLTVPQAQWYLPDAPGGAVLVVDRWSFEGLSTRIAGAGWATADQ